MTSWALLMLNAVVKPATDTIHGVRPTNPLAIQALEPSDLEGGRRRGLP